MIPFIMKISNQKKEIKKEIVSLENAQVSVKKKRTYSESIEFDKIETFFLESKNEKTKNLGQALNK